MMDTVLNIGLNDTAVEGLARLTGNERFAYDSYRRLINMFGDTVMGVDHHHFEHELSAVKEAAGVELDTDLSPKDLKEVVERYKRVYQQHVGSEFPATRTSSSPPPSRRCSRAGWATARSATAS
jgi:pyruvate,orthophosphate dikinase